MKSIKLIFIVIMGLHILSSCSRIYINEISKSYGFDKENKKSVLIVGINGLSLNEFVKTYHKKYKEDQEFIMEYSDLFTNKLLNENLFASVRYDKSPRWNLIKSFVVSPQQSKIIDSLFNSCNSDYLISLSDFDISNRVSNSSYMSGGGSGMMMSSSNEYCVIKARVQIFDTKNRQKLSEFITTGEGSVFFFAFEAALTEAINNSVYHGVQYLKTGKTKF